ncbi:DUF3105 domain-containing protein [Nocardioides ungokensis]|uniref:DUF3105 domain-containing protein n=1 Tax=Nocardioides ungokensis TaxID=1643322 RepID=UPI0015DE8DC7|nr:DUF3105 domain-containing protein [Nocardioides ungokensis]
MSQPAPPSYDVPPAPPTPPSSRRPVVIALVAAFVVLALAVVVPVAVQRLRAGQEAAVTADLSEVRDYPDLPRDHVEGDVDYAQVPPVGGKHDPVWLDCGAYDAPVRDENAVHDLEHGSVWITYRPDLDAAGVRTLADALPQNGILSPYVGLPAPVVVTVWGRQLWLTGADDPRLALFIQRYGAGRTAPEPFASCAGGVREPSGGSGSGTSV